MRDYALTDGDLLISRSGTIGRAFLYDATRHGPCAYAGYLVRFVPGPTLFPRFAFFFTQSKSFEQWLSLSVIASTIGNVNGQKYADMQLAHPPLNEQRAIAAFLDRETKRIDELIAKKRRLIELLAEKRTALISHAVTKGLNPNVKMKDSGVEWLGEIPEHWEARRFKFLLSEALKYGANEVGELDDPDLPRYVRITDINHNGTLRDETFKSLPGDIAQPYLLKEGDLLFARSGATVGKTFLYSSSWGQAAYAGYLIRARLAPVRMFPQFAAYFTQSDNYWNWLRSSFIQATIQNVSAERYANLILSVPPLREQGRMVEHLDRETARIDALIEKVRKSIDLLREYRTALISAAVTGKIDVRERKKAEG